jgi:hypothetical protein
LHTGTDLSSVDHHRKALQPEKWLQMLLKRVFLANAAGP